MEGDQHHLTIVLDCDLDGGRLRYGELRLCQGRTLVDLVSNRTHILIVMSSPFTPRQCGTLMDPSQSPRPLSHTRNCNTRKKCIVHFVYRITMCRDDCDPREIIKMQGIAKTSSIPTSLRRHVIWLKRPTCQGLSGGSEIGYINDDPGSRQNDNSIYSIYP